MVLACVSGAEKGGRFGQFGLLIKKHKKYKLGTHLRRNIFDLPECVLVLRSSLLLQAFFGAMTIEN